MKKLLIFFLILFVILILFVAGFMSAAVFNSSKNKNISGEANANANSTNLDNFTVSGGKSAVRSTDLDSFAVSGTKSAVRQLVEKTGRPAFGNPQAKLVIVQFGDFQCPHTGEEFPIIREIISRYQKQIFFIYRNYPAIDNNSPTIAAAALCANEQGKFWPVHDRMYLGQSQGFTDEILRDIAKRSGLDLAKYDDCAKKGTYLPAVQEDFNDATILGVLGTPTFFVNGHKLEGVVTKEQWEQIINKALEILK
ncbi:MAG: thioredoxin domain-containing protein [Patescibacteria group bacterium]